jgi:hypothetical protein
MSTQHSKAKLGAVPTPEFVPSEAVNSYLDFLSTAQEKFAASLKDSRARAARVNDCLLEAMLDAQREAIATGKRIAANPQDLATNAKTVMEAATAAQERGLAVAKALYQEQADIAAEMRKLWDGAMKSSTEFSEGAKKFSALWPKVA